MIPTLSSKMHFLNFVLHLFFKKNFFLRQSVEGVPVPLKIVDSGPLSHQYYENESILFFITDGE